MKKFDKSKIHCVKVPKDIQLWDSNYNMELFLYLISRMYKKRKIEKATAFIDKSSVESIPYNTYNTYTYYQSRREGMAKLGQTTKGGVTEKEAQK